MKKSLSFFAGLSLLSLLLINTQLVYGQIVNSSDNSPSYQLTNNSDLAFLSIRIVSSGDDAPEGTLYLNESFMPATILFHNTKQKVLLPARYNASFNEIEIKRDGNIVAITPIAGMEVLLDNKSFVNVENPKNRKSVFVQKLAGGNYKLYDFFEIKINKAPSDATLLNIDLKDEIKIKSSFYFQIKDGSIIQLPRNKKDLKNKFDQSALDFLKKQKLNLKNKEDAIEFFQYLNSR